MKKLIFILLFIPALVFAQEETQSKYVGLFINLGNLPLGGIELGVENNLTENMIMRSSAKLNSFNTGTLDRSHLAFQQQFLILRNRAKNKFYYGPSVQIGEANFYGDWDLDFIYSFFFGAGMHAGSAWQISNNFTCSLGLGIGLNYLKYKGNPDIYGGFSPEILDNQLFMLNRHWEISPELMVSFTYSLGFPDKKSKTK